MGGDLISVLGWDVGGANVKAAWIALQSGEILRAKVASRPFEIWRDKERLPDVLRSVADEVASEPPSAIALTMTAELSDVFQTKREGVLFILDQVQAVHPDCQAYALSVDGGFVPLAESKERPLDFAASNWMATAMLVAQRHPDCILVDVGSTTTDIIPIIYGSVASQGRNDVERLMCGELVYTGALRTHLAAIVQAVPVGGRLCPVSSEYFAISGDVHLILGNLRPEDYTCPTPDGRPPSVASARQRLARLVCADSEMLTSAEIDEMAAFIYQRQIGQISQALHQVLSRTSGCALPVVVAGMGAFLASAAAREAGLETIDLAAEWGEGASAVAPCYAVALLLAQFLGER